MSDTKYRLVTRSDFDGLVCAAMFKEMDMIDEIKFVHPKDMQDGKIEITSADISCNLPYVPGVGMAFDHHASEATRVDAKDDNYINDPDASSAARVVYDHFGGRGRFKHVDDEMMMAVDKADAAHFTKDDVLDAEDWELLSFIMDSRTGLGRFRDFRISNYQLMMDLTEMLLKHSIDEILDQPDVKERVDLYMEHKERHKDQIRSCTTVHNNVAVLDLREQETIYAGNRFVIYALYPETSVSIHCMWGLHKKNVVFAIGKSVLNRGSAAKIGELCLKYGGGGHDAAGTCQVPTEDADGVLPELVAALQD